MAKLIYTAIASLDGYTADKDGKFDWSAPDEEVHAFVNDLERPIGTYLLGRRMYEVLKVWQHPETFAGDDAVMLDYAAVWQAADKVVYSTTLVDVSTLKTRLERTFDAEAVLRLKASADRDLSVGGAGLAAEALRAGLVDEVQLLLSPVSVGGGTSALPRDLQVKLELLDQRRFANGVVYLHHRVER